ncbi:MAG: ribosome-associated translation inhibitor RaiA [Candidatus Acidulodesulfobacterium acidiphilum]|uniref:Ribosome-associated translation inhibitor RaiA n=1 Tax=Candidatus Acidulodesulfobacterium acidiphilum TaxID=2597224 RepID=A0A520X8U6_9DELT|nr:MAG: ribosome-associated translation inhibitor RaiA [Candidatus Acidulodesulfobacterium acidiphilum]
MNIAVTFKHIDSSDAIRQYAESKFPKLEKYLNNIMDVHITLSIERVDHKESGVAQIKLTAKNLTVNAEEKSADIYSAIDLLLEKVESQIKKHKEKMRRKEHVEEGADLFSETDDDSSLDIAIKDDYERQPLSVKEALHKLEKRNKDFIIFKDKESSKVSFIYRGDDGEISMITPEF